MSAGSDLWPVRLPKIGGIAICAPIAPYAATRREIRTAIEAYGGFIEAHVATPLAECEKRDRKGYVCQGQSRSHQGVYRRRRSV